MIHDKLGKNLSPLIDKLFRLALSITGNKQDAEDVVQDTMFHVWRKKDEWGAIQNWEAYCFRSTRNIAIDKLALKDNRQESLPEGFDIQEPSINAHERLEAEEGRKFLEKQIRQLPETQQTIFQLREVGGFTYKQIAEILNVSEEQVKINLFRSRQKLKKQLEHFKL
jgi:RNA polymerase sigma-70 factor (ECF subfamily)